MTPLRQQRSQRDLLILDIDETLIYTTLWPDRPCDFYLFKEYGSILRPGVMPFLRWCFASAPRFDTAIWTAGTADYAAEVLRHLLLPGEVPAFVFSRERCSRVMARPDEDDMPSFYEIKDLRKVHRLGYNLNRVLMVDNTPSVLRRNYGNLIPIPSFTGDPNDRYLERLPDLITEWFKAPNVRALEKRGWWRSVPGPIELPPALRPPEGAAPMTALMLRRAAARSSARLPNTDPEQ